MFQQSVYWFPGVLFALFVLLAWVHAANPRLRATVPRVEQPRPRLFVAFIALTAAGSILASPSFGLDDWLPLSLLFVVLAGLAYVGFRMSGLPVTVPERALAAVLFSAFCLAALIAAVALLQRRVNGVGPAWRTLAANAYGIYYVHPLILYPLAYVLLDLPAPAVAKAAILVAVTLAASLAVSAHVLKRLPGLRRMF